MATTAGTPSLVSAGQTTASVIITAATAGTAPYTYQWYKSTTSGFSPGGGNIIAGATSLALNDTGLIPGTQYYYKNVATDSSSPAVTSNSVQLAVATLNPVQSQNQFAQSSQVGMVDLAYNYDTIGAMADVTLVGSLYAGAAVKLVPQGAANSVPRVIGCAANSDEVFGFINYNIKNPSWVANQAMEISQAGNVMYLYATAAITQGTQVQLDLTTNGGVAPKTGSSGADYVGWALDGAAAAGQLIRVRLAVPSFTKF